MTRVTQETARGGVRGGGQEQTDHVLALPEMVVEEYLAHYRHDVEASVNKTRGAIDDLRRLAPDWHGQVPRSCLSRRDGREKPPGQARADLPNTSDPGVG